MLSDVHSGIAMSEDILRNRMEIVDTTGGLSLFEDDNINVKFSVNTAVTDDSTRTIRKRLE
jgi:hypothetical protein